MRRADEYRAEFGRTSASLPVRGARRARPRLHLVGVVHRGAERNVHRPASAPTSSARSIPSFSMKRLTKRGLAGQIALPSGRGRIAPIPPVHGDQA